MDVSDQRNPCGLIPMPSNILVTGSAGFIGQKLVAALSVKYPTVRGIDIKSGNDFAYHSFGEETPDVIVHCAAYVSVTDSEKKPAEYIYNNLDKLAVFLKNMPPTTKFILLSTGGALYGDREQAKEEDASLDHCTNVYAMTKLVGEYLVRKYAQNYLILRLANVTGDGEDDRGEKNCVTHFRQDDPIVVYGGDQKREFIEVDAVVGAIMKGIENDIQGTFNLGAGKVFKILELAKHFGEERNVPVIIEPARQGEVKDITLDSSEAKKAGLL